MPPMLTTILFLVTCTGAAFCGLYWTGVFIHLIKFLSNRPTARTGIALAKTSPPSDTITVIVPAHNESRVIEPLIKSLREQTYPHVHFILALDRCSDDTALKAYAAIAGDPRFTVLEIAECPPDWAGKVHAINSAVHMIRAQNQLPDLLLFADADTRFSPDAIAATIAILRDRKLEFLSLLSTLSTDKWFEKVVQTAACMEVTRQYPLERVNATDESRRPFANGQFMLFDRKAYDASGGHAAVKDAILEDLALAQLFAEQKRPAQVLISDNIIRCHMYDTFSAFKNGWKRIYIECVDWKVSRLTRYGWAIMLTGCIFPLWSIALATAGILVLSQDMGKVFNSYFPVWPATVSAAHIAAYLGSFSAAIFFLAIFTIYRLAAAPMIFAFTHPVGAFLTGGILLDAARDVKNRVPMRWGGREYSREPR